MITGILFVILLVVVGAYTVYKNPALKAQCLVVIEAVIKFFKTLKSSE
jgi:hypothetical protein